MTLNSEQSRALDAVKTGQNIFLTGSPGTGKSYTLRNIIEYLKTKNIKYAITSSTGCAAVIIGGQTIHSYLGLGIGNNKIDKIVLTLKKNKTKYTQLQELQLLILDEISMIDDSTLTKISEVLKNVKNNKKPFGGIQVILVGDFCQLSPVEGQYAFQSDVWKELDLVCIQLTELIRQKDDKEFQEILQEVRFGKCSKNTIKQLAKLQNTTFDDIKPTKLYPLNSHVNAINNIEFEKLYLKNNKTSIDKAHIVDCWPINPNLEFEMDLLHISEYDVNKDIFQYYALTNDKKCNLDDYKIQLFKGLQVMVTRNINIDRGIVNGTTGIITSLNNLSVCIKCNNGIHHTINYHKDVNENNGTYVKFMPIRLAYAISIHKSQGATLDAVEIDASTNIFAAGQLYTAMSRARNLNSIKLLNFDHYSFICNPTVKEFYCVQNENIIASKI